MEHDGLHLSSAEVWKMFNESLALLEENMKTAKEASSVGLSEEEARDALDALKTKALGLQTCKICGQTCTPKLIMWLSLNK